MKRLTPYSWLILIIFSSCLTGNKVASTDKQELNVKHAVSM